MVKLPTLKCPICGWGARIEYLARTDEYICRHCGHKWNKAKKSKGGE